MPQNKIPRIRLTRKQQKELASDLDYMIERAREYHSTWSELHRLYLRQYLCEPEVAKKTWPWENASNLFLPVGRTIMDGILAQLHDAMFSNDPPMMVIGSEFQDSESAEALSKFYGEYVYKKVIPLTQRGNDWNYDICLDGTGTVLPRWQNDRYLQRTMRPELKPKTRTIKDEIFGVDVTATEVTGYDEIISEDIKLNRDAYPTWDIVDMESIFFAPDSIIDTQFPNTDWYFIERDLTREQLLARKREGYDNIDDELLAQLAPRDLKETEREGRQVEELGEAPTQHTVKVVEMYMRLVLPAEYNDGDKVVTQRYGDENGYPEEVVITYFPSTGKISRVVPLWRLRPDGRRPHIVNRYMNLKGTIYGFGIQAKMRHLNAWMNAAANQMTDYGTLQNLPWFFYSPHATGGPLPNLTMKPGAGIPVDDPSGIREMKLAGDYNFGLNMLYFGHQTAERDGQISDQTIGRMPERSANKTARGMALVQQQANIAFGRLASLMAAGYTEAFRATHALYRRHQANDIVFKVTGSRKGVYQEMTLPRHLLQQDVDFTFVLNPDRRNSQQVAMSLYQLMMQIPYVAQNPAAVRELARQVYVSIGSPQGIRNFDEIFPESMVQSITNLQTQQITGGQGMQLPPGEQDVLENALDVNSQELDEEDISVKLA